MIKTPFDTESSSGRYEIKSSIGRGSTCEVYRARDKLLDRPVALKCAEKELLEISPHYSSLFAREAKYQARLEHPNILPLYDFGLLDQVPFIASRFVSKGSLNRSRRLPPDKIISIALQVSSAIDYCNDLGIAHRDIKPGNILIDESSHVYLTDFGLACRFESDEYKNGAGSLYFVAPEQLNHSIFKGTGTSCDLFALGVTIYVLLTGRPPMPPASKSKYFYLEPDLRDKMKHCTAYRLMAGEKIIPVSRWVNVPHRVNDVLFRMMAINPSDRFSTSTEAVKELQEAFDNPLPGKIFVSYSTKDKEYVAKIVNGMKKIGLSSWWSDRIKIGRWGRVIEKQLNICDAMLVILTENSVDSDGVRNEWGYWLDPHFEKPIITLVLGNCRIPYRLYGYQHIYAEGKSLNEIMEELTYAFRDAMKTADLRYGEQISGEPLEDFGIESELFESFDTEIKLSSESLGSIIAISPDKILRSNKQEARYVPRRYLSPPDDGFIED